MKKILILTFFFWIQSTGALFSQTYSGNDVIILLDNSGSISDTEFGEMRTSTLAIIRNILDCNPNNKVSVVHYGTDTIKTNIPKIWIEYDFTDDILIAQNFQQHLKYGNDFLHESLGLTGNALDHIFNSNIVSPQKVLNRTPSNGLVVYIFTDGYRSNSGTFLVNYYNPNPVPNLGEAFQNFTEFKKDRNARFIMTHVSPNDTSTAAGAGIASLGGLYNGPLIESYPTDPDGSGVLPRRYLLKNNFILSPSEISDITEDICSNILEFEYEPRCGILDNIYNVYGNVSIPNGGTITNLKMYLKNIATSIEYEVNSIPTISGTQFHFLFNYFDIMNIPHPIQGYYQMVVKLEYTVGGIPYALEALSNYYYWYNYQYELSFDCCLEDLYAYYVSPGETNILIAGNSVTAYNTIENGAKAIYTGGNYVSLLPGFDAKAGSDVYAFIEGCIMTNLKFETPPFEYRKSSGNGIPDNKEYSKRIIRKEINASLKDLKIYPNPVSDELTIESNSKVLKVEIYDISGKKMLVKLMKNKINVSTLSKGNYIIHIETDDGITTEKFTKK